MAAAAEQREELALVALYRDVGALFAEEGTACEQPFGWRDVHKQLGDQPRIVWVPGDPQGGLGEFAPARNPGREPRRPLQTLRELFTCHITGFNRLEPDSEIAQYAATRLLYDAWVRGLYLSATGQFSLKSQRWEVKRAESRYGATLIVVGAIDAMIPDTALATAPATTKAVISSEMQGQTEIDEIEPEE